MTVPIYPTLSAAQVRYILKDSGARVVFVSTRLQLDKVQEVRHQLPSLEAIIVMDGGAAQREPVGHVDAGAERARPRSR